MAMNTPPIRAAFFEAEVELAQRNPNLPPLKLAVKFQRTTREWAQWVGNMARAVGFPIQSLTATASLDFPSINAGASADLTITVDGVKLVDPQPVVDLGLPAGLTAGLVFQAWVSADNTVTVRATNASTGAINQGAATFRVEVRRY